MDEADAEADGDADEAKVDGDAVCLRTEGCDVLRFLDRDLARFAVDLEES